MGRGCVHKGEEECPPQLQLSSRRNFLQLCPLPTYAPGVERSAYAGWLQGHCGVWVGRGVMCGQLLGWDRVAGREEGPEVSRRVLEGFALSGESREVGRGPEMVGGGVRWHSAGRSWH